MASERVTGDLTLSAEVEEKVDELIDVARKSLPAREAAKIHFQAPVPRRDQTIPQFIAPIDMTDYECCICQNLIVEPVSTECHHRFCNSCILKWLDDTRHTCPMCRTLVFCLEVTKCPMDFKITADRVATSTLTADEQLEREERGGVAFYELGVPEIIAEINSLFSPQ